MRRALAASALVLTLAGCGTAEGPTGEADLTASGTVEEPYDATKDVALGPCKVDAYQSVTSQVTVTNHSGAARSYTVTAELVRGSERLADLDASANKLRPGQTAKELATGFVNDGVVTAGAACRLLSVVSYEDTP